MWRLAVSHLCRVLVIEAHHLVLDDADLVLEHAGPLGDLVRVRARYLLPQVILLVPVAKDVDCARFAQTNQRA